MNDPKASEHAPSSAELISGGSLEQFFDIVRSNQRANRVRFPEWYEIIERIDGCLVRAGKDLITRPTHIMTGSLLFRCQYAFKTAAALALAGQVVEAFVIQRSVLEHAGYCLLIFEKPELESVFFGRHIGVEEMKKQKEAFKIVLVKAAIQRFNAPLVDVFDENYQQAINFGAHPNPGAILSTMISGEHDGQHGFAIVATATDPKTVVFALRSTAQVGLTALGVLEQVFKERFLSLGIRREIGAIIETEML
jgi:hypothetical protein